MPERAERPRRIAATLNHLNLDALVCTLPENVLLLTGYWPVVGTAVAVATRDGRCAVVAPEDEQDLAAHGWAEVRTYQPGALHRQTSPEAAIREPLSGLLSDLGVATGRVAHDEHGTFEPASYSAMHLFRGSTRAILASAAPDADVSGGADAVSELRSAYTPAEVDVIREACRVAGEGFIAGQGTIAAGKREPEVAAAIAGAIEVGGHAVPSAQRAGAFVWCMSGPNSALAGAAYARTRNRTLEQGDFVLVHCNSYLDGYWTDITRTFCLGAPDEQKQSIYDAIFAAREAALAVIRPGARAVEVDAAARRVLDDHGLGQYFTHGVGHNVGFSAISGEYPPLIHPASTDTLEEGMTFNVEPSVYIHGYGGVRHCDVVTVRAGGVEVLTPFLGDARELSV